MHVSCDVTLESNEGQVFEWVLFVRASSYAHAVEFVEQATVDRWRGTLRIEEMFVSLDTNSREKQASGDDETPGVYATREPRELVQHTPLLKRLIDRLSGGRG